jgi:hypothetical protein
VDAKYYFHIDISWFHNNNKALKTQFLKRSDSIKVSIFLNRRIKITLSLITKKS